MEALAHHLTCAVAGGVLSYGAVKLLPAFLKSSTGQQMLAAIGPGSKPAQVAAVARDMMPALNTLYKSQQGQQQQRSITIDPARLRRFEPLPMQPFVRAKGGTVNPELARIQRERLRLPVILETLDKRK